MTLVRAAEIVFGQQPWTTRDFLDQAGTAYRETLPATLQYAMAHSRDGGVRALGRHLNSGAEPGIELAGKDRRGVSIWKVRTP